MANSDFFDQFGEKMRSLHPTGNTAGADWLALSQRLDAVLPAPAKRRLWAVPLLALLLLASNVWWGFTFQRQNRLLENLTAQVAALKNAPAPAKETVACDEVNALRAQVADLQTRLDEASAGLAKSVFYPPSLAEKSAGVFSKTGNEMGGALPDFAAKTSAGKSVFSENARRETGEKQPDFSTKTSDKAHLPAEVSPLVFLENEHPVAAPALPEKLPLPDLFLLKIPNRSLLLLPGIATVKPPVEDKKDRSVTKKLAAAVQPKIFRIGATGGWLYPLEKDMEHQTGYSCGLQADVGFSRQFSLSAEWGRVTLHYKALAQDAAIGLPSLPLPSPEHQFLEMDVSNQRLVFYGLGLRYKGLLQGSWHPFGSLGWTGVKVLPFMAHYETEMAGSIFKGTHSVQQRSELKNFARLGAGVEFPLGKRFEWSLEGYYLHSWRNVEPDLAGVRTGLSFIF